MDPYVGPKVKPHEEVLNVCLSKILSKVLGERSVVIPERVTAKGKKRFDIKIDYKGIEFIIEASYYEADAVEDAKRRIEEGFIDTVAIALRYDPTRLAHAATTNEIETVLTDSEMKLKVFSLGLDISDSLVRYTSGKVRTSRERTKYWIIAKVDEFPQLLDSIVEFLVTEDILVSLTDEIEQRTDEFIRHSLEAIDKLPKLETTLLRNLYLALFSSSGKDEAAVLPDVPREVILAHTYISLMMASILYETVASRHGLNPLQRIMTKEKEHPLLAMKKAFTEILHIDYEPVFDIAVSLVDYLFDLQTKATIMQDLRELIETVQHIVINRAVLRRDFIGHVYHKITGNIATRKGYATFFTKAPIAYFLAYICLHTPNNKWPKNWRDLTTSTDFKVCDFACGSGTLLSASYAALQTLYRKACFNEEDQPDLKKFHQNLLGDCAWGFDALEHATQTASVVLSLHETGVPLKKMRVYHVPVDRTGSLGSLNFWWADRQLVPVARRGIEKVDMEQVVLRLFNLIIMNPPFSRATAPGVEGSRPRIFDFVSSQAVFDRLWGAYMRLVRNIEQGIKQNKATKKLFSEYVGRNRPFMNRNVDPLYAGAALPFFFLADRYLKTEGRVGLVLPRTALESSSFFLLRCALVSGYDIEYIIVSSEEGNPNFSYSAQFSEALLVARKTKKRKNLSDSNTYVINLRKQPKDVLSGILAAKDVLRTLPPKGQQRIVKAHNAEIRAISRNTVEEFVWNFAPILALPPWIQKVIGQMVEGKLLGIPLKLCRFMDLPNLLMTNPRKFRGSDFTSMYSLSSTGGFHFLNRTGKKVINRLELDLSNTVRISPLNEKASVSYEKSGGRLLVPEAIRFNTTPLIAAWSPKEIVSSRAHMIKAKPDLEQALCAWMNSIFGIIWLRTLFTTLEDKFGHIYGWHMRILRIPNLMDRSFVDELGKIFSKYSETMWPPLPEQFGKDKEMRDSTRFNYDLDILRALSNASNETLVEEEARIGLKAIYREILQLV